MIWRNAVMYNCAVLVAYLRSSDYYYYCVGLARVRVVKLPNKSAVVAGDPAAVAFVP